MERPSVYLVEKTDALNNALDFFIADKSNVRSTADEKRLAFLGQFDFWLWEIDNLIYSYENFVERQAVWETTSDLKQAMGRNKMTVRAHIMRKVRWSNFYDSYRFKKIDKTVAPHEMLNQTIDKWNKLLDLLDDKYIDPQAKNAVNLGAQIHPDLKQFRKEHVKIEEPVVPEYPKYIGWECSCGYREREITGDYPAGRWGWVCGRCGKRA